MRPNFLVKLTPKAALLVPSTRFDPCGASLPWALDRIGQLYDA